MGPREISIVMTTEEWKAMLEEADNIDEQVLSPTARATLWGDTPHPLGIPASSFTCSIDIATELLAWAQTAMTRWRGVAPAYSATFRAAARQVQFALWRVGEGPAPGPDSK